jgi:hypothetical protein
MYDIACAWEGGIGRVMFRPLAERNLLGVLTHGPVEQTFHSLVAELDQKVSEGLTGCCLLGQEVSEGLDWKPLLKCFLEKSL